MVLAAALVFALVSAPALAGHRDEHPAVKSENPPAHKKDRHRPPDKVTVKFFNGSLREGKDVAITVTDACDRTISKATTEFDGPKAEGEGADVASVALRKQPKGRYDVRVEYWPAEEDEGTEEDEIPEDEGTEDSDPDPDGNPPDEPEIYKYHFSIHLGPHCDGEKDRKKDKDHHGGGKTKRSWGSTGGDGHDGHGANDDNLRSPDAMNESTGSTHSTHTPSGTTSFPSYTSPSYTSPSERDHFDHRDNDSSSTTFGDSFGDATGNSPISDPTDPSLYSAQPGQVPEEAEDQQQLNASSTLEEVDPGSGTLVVALTIALLLGVGGGLFLRRTEPAPVRPRR